MGACPCSAPTRGGAPIYPIAPVRDLLGLGEGIGGGHPRRLEDVRAHVLVVALAAHPFDERAEQEEAVVGVPERRPGSMGSPRVPLEREVVPVLAQRPPLPRELRAEDVAGPSACASAGAGR